MTDQNFKQKFCGDLGVFYEGLAVAQVNGEWYHILENGAPAYPERYQMAEYFQQGLAWVKKEGKWIRINNQGKEAKNIAPSVD
ncbi:MAG: WG repeat-containing protein [Patescibacteria group bacterium]